MPQVSVIIPVFNSARLISSAVRSVFAQTFQDFEVLVVDDGSDDGEELLAALAPWPHRLTYIRQENGGPARARNRGIAAARGELIAFLDADDEWLPEKLARQVDYYRSHPQTGLLHTAAIGVDHVGLPLAGPPRHAFCELFHTDFFVNTLTVMVPRRVLKEVGPFDERREVHIEDWDLWLRIAARHPVGFIAEPLALHRSGGMMSSQLERTYAAQALVIEKNWTLCTQACAAHRAAPAECERRRLHVLHRDWGDDLLTAGDRAQARDHFRRALGHRWQTRAALLYAASLVPNGWRRWLLALGRPAARAEAAARAASRSKQPAPPSLVHDTIYRRARPRVIAKLHDLDDALTSARRPRKRILFDAASPMSFTVFQPIYERLRRDGRLELWFTSAGGVWSLEEIYGPAGVTSRVVPAARAAWMKVDAYINTDFWDMMWLHRRTRRLHLFHGVAGKYGLDAPVDLAPTIAAFDSLMFANADRRRRYVEASLVPDDDLKAALVGYPKVDRLVDGSLHRDAVAEALGLDPRRPIVIYAPTWSPYSSLNGMGEEIVERLRANGFQVIVKLHDRSYDRRQRGSGGIDWAQRLARYADDPHVRVAREADGTPLLAAADAMVSDHSSIAFEYMLLDRPIVVIDCPRLIEKAAINPEKVERLRSAAVTVRDPRAMALAVDRGLRQPSLLSERRRQTGAELFYRPGTATERAVALVYRFLELPRPLDAATSVVRAQELAPAG